MEHDAVFITNASNILYRTGFVTQNTREREAYVFVTNEVVYLFTNSLNIEYARELATSKNFTCIELTPEQTIYKQLASIAEKLNLTSIQFEQDNLTIDEFKKLHAQMPTIALVGTTSVTEKLRMIKNATERAYIQESADCTDSCFSYVLKHIHKGQSEAEIAWMIESYFHTHHATSAFSPVVAFNQHTSEPHHIPSGDTKLSNNSLLLLDFGARMHGYCADLTRMVVLGKPKKIWIDVYTAVVKAQTQAIEYLAKGGSSGAEVDHIARSVIESHAYPPYPHSLGHGVGIDIHEYPRLHSSKDIHLKPNMVITIEPGVYIPEKFGIRIEDLLCINEHGIDVLSKAPKELLSI